MDKTNRQILQIALPSIVSNITVPLLGLIDVAITGHLGATSYIGAIAVGGMLFNIIYWVFGFLRMGTGGMVAQAFGRRDRQEIIRLLLRSVTVAFSIAMMLVMAQKLINLIAFALIEASPEVREYAKIYFSICIWGAPAVLGLYSFNGWFIGMQNTRIPMFIAITQNMVNIFTSLLLVYVLNLKIEGVAIGTVVAQYAGFFMAYGLWRKNYRHLKPHISFEGLFERTAMMKFFKVNRDIFFRTICLVAVTVYFTSAGSAQGEVILAVNTLLMELFMLDSYIMDGFAYAGEALTGRFIGAEDKNSLRVTIKRLFIWGAGLAAIFTILYAVAGIPFLHILTNDQSVIAASKEYFFWVLLIPYGGFAAFLFDGIFTGATATKMMLQSMFIATLSFFILYFGLRSIWGNHALWFSFIVYLLLRGVLQGWLGRKIIS
ncbi:MAG: MATE family efflux transporter [Phocaeicola sp.]|uniref:MATE family efflux transporter n=1 Tax=Phocaeicola sp. TaxID=2773926 RepID=UPI003F9F990E